MYILTGHSKSSFSLVVLFTAESTETCIVSELDIYLLLKLIFTEFPSTESNNTSLDEQFKESEY